MRYAFISDVHGKSDVLRDLLRFLGTDQMDMIICLGDSEKDPVYDLLRSACALGTFGNYEVSGYPRLSAANQRYVLRLPYVFCHNDLLAAHAVPYHPPGVSSVIDSHEYLTNTGAGWQSLFPYLGEDSAALWKIYAELQVKGKHLFFHGHTHRQQVRAISPNERLTNTKERQFIVERDTHYIIGVGSLGLPHDGPHPAYTVYDDQAHKVELRVQSN
jgi:predicted phosphodiesterase